MFKYPLKESKLKNYLDIVIGFIFLISLSGCVSASIENAATPAIKEAVSEDKITNEQTALAMGQRTFDVSKKND